jgi:hypothetical protein
MTQPSKFMDPNIKNPEFGILMIPLCKLRDRQWILLYYFYKLFNLTVELLSIFK